MKIFIFLTTFLLVACTPPEATQLEQNNSPSYAASNYPTKWTRGFPLSLNISTDFTSDEIQAIELAANNWENSLDNEINFFNVQTQNISAKSALGSYNDGYYGVYKLFDWPSELPSTALAVTQINGTQMSSYIRIDQADILVNYDYYDFATDGSWGYDLATVVLHEMGHFLGLYHDKSSKENSVMYPSIGRFSDNKYPLSNDIEKLASKYGVSSKLAVASNHQVEGEKITFILELYPDKELIRINGVSYEIHHP